MWGQEYHFIVTVRASTLEDAESALAVRMEPNYRIAIPHDVTEWSIEERD